MDIFDIEEDDLLKLDATQLEKLILRLAEAELASKGYSPADVYRSGSMTASDGGIDIHVQVPVEQLDIGFLRRPDTVFQAKKSKMQPSKITKEMQPDGKLSSAIVKQASRKGSYIIVSLGDDCSPPEREKRLNAMKKAVSDDPNKSDLHLDFYDRSKLQQWLRQHPSVMLWVKEQLGEGYSGWRAYGKWSNPPKGVDDRLILASGIIITLPSGKREKRSLKDAIEPMRDLIKNTKKVIRIIGLSGVGKTRIVQALFDETIGSNALDRTMAVYADVGDEIKPSATEMLDKLIAKKQQAIMILDNCSSELHSSLARKASASGDMVKLITIEYDIREDEPQTTDVIRIEAVGPEVAKQLLLRRFPKIGHNNACRIAEFANGNARVSLAIAERVEEGESLAQLSDDQLFNRLFVQRHDPDANLRKQAEILSLVYSFSIDDSDENQNELEILGSLLSYSYDDLYRTVNTLFERGIVQKRGNWRAILPQVIANKLAIMALNSIPVKKLRATFEAPNRQRLLMSFAHRLGLLHEHFVAKNKDSVAKKLVEPWLQPGGLLEQLCESGDIPVQILSYIAPVAPELLLNWIEKWFTEHNSKDPEPHCNPDWGTLCDLLQAIAYEPDTFERCTKLLIQMADNEVKSRDYNSACDTLTRFFQASLSGTHASLEQRIALMKECINSGIEKRRSLGFEMLSTALQSSGWIAWNYEFGAQSRDYGFEPDPDKLNEFNELTELIEWYSAFIDVAVSLGNSGESCFEQRARSILAENFRGLWHQETLRDKLIKAAQKLNKYCHWGEGWIVICLMIRDYTSKDKNNLGLAPDNLVALKDELYPRELIPKIMTYVLDGDQNNEDRAFQLGQEFALSQHKFDELADKLFSNNNCYNNNIIAFGKGLAKCANDIQISWQQLVEQLEQCPETDKNFTNKNFSVFKGFIEEVNAKDVILAQQLLDQCADHPILKQVLVGLHPWSSFTEKDLDRCIKLLDEPDINLFMYSPILWPDHSGHLPEERLLDLASQLLKKPEGEIAVLYALGTKHWRLSPEFRLIGLKAAIQKIQKRNDDRDSLHDEVKMEYVIDAALRFKGNESEKLNWLDAIFSFVDHHGNIGKFKKSIEITAAFMPEAFLNRFIEGFVENSINKRCDRLEGMLSKIDIDVIIEWCKAKNNPQAWKIAAAGIELWSENSEQIQHSSLKLLEASPYPKVVLTSFAKRISIGHTYRTGSRVDIMQPRVNAIEKLKNHERADISEAAKEVYNFLIKQIEDKKKAEDLKDQEWRQRFE